MSDNKLRFDLDDFLDEFFPPVSSLAGLVFANDGDFERARALVRKNLGAYIRANPKERYLVIRKTDVERITGAGLTFEEIELHEPEPLSPEEEYEAQRAMIQSEEVQRAMAEMLRPPRDRA
jgi:hypothetical protein